MKMYSSLILMLSCLTIVLSNPLQLEVTDAAPKKNCTRAGLMCESCDTSAMCVKMGNTFQKFNEMTCPPGSTCLAGICTTEVNPPCDYQNIKFLCNYRGTYPHPGDWSKFVYCIPVNGTLTAYTMDCEAGTGYNAKTTYCSRNLSTINPSSFPIPRCQTRSVAPLVHPDNPSIYYICSVIDGKLYPVQFTCPSGGTFANGECKIVLTDESKRKIV